MNWMEIGMAIASSIVVVGTLALKWWRPRSEKYAKFLPLIHDAFIAVEGMGLAGENKSVQKAIEFVRHVRERYTAWTGSEAPKDVVDFAQLAAAQFARDAKASESTTRAIAEIVGLVGQVLKAKRENGS